MDNLSAFPILSLTFQKFSCKKSISDIFLNYFNLYKSGADAGPPFFIR